MRFHLGFYIILTTVPIKVLCDCGKMAPDADPSDANKDGIGADIFPWHVVIYERKTDGSFGRWCFGNLISSDVVITAARCISQTPGDLNRFYVVSGNYTPYIIPSNMTIDKTRIDTFHKGKGYDAWNGNSAGDIVWLVLEHPLKITSSLGPACIDLENRQNKKELSIGLVGQILYRPSQDNTARAEIRRMEIFNSSHEHCYRIFPEVRRHNISLNPSCARLLTKTSSFYYFIGSGFYSQHDGRWYLRAIITDVYVIKDDDGPHNIALMMDLERFIDQINNSGALKSIVIIRASGCGIAAPPVNSLIINGFRAELGRFPWHVAVYREESNGRHSQICAGSLISTKVVISAAHCFYDEVRRRKLAADKFAIAAGKFYRLYDAEESFVQKSSVLTIHLPRTYYGVAGNYAEDIAWLILQHPFYYSAVVTPVCIDKDNSRQEEDLRAGRVGKVVGWGRTEAGVFSNELQEVNLPFIPYETCISALSSEFTAFLTFDKFCAGYLNGTSLCDGDSGGGLAFYRGGIWYLRGIVSLSPVSSRAGTCPNFYTAFTNIGYHTAPHQRIINISTRGKKRK